MRDKNIYERLNISLKEVYERDIRIMEVCGTHTQAISKSGIRDMLPKEILLLSGPGCPVCVTSEAYIDLAIKLLELEDVEILTFGDMLRVRGTCHSLTDKKSQGAKIRIIYSPEDILDIAEQNRGKRFIFLAVGFETTAPLIAATVRLANARGICNLFFLTALKRMEPVIQFILQDERNRIDAMICPGHVASIMGADYFRFITEEFGIPAVVCGFETTDIAAGICMLLEQLNGKRTIEFVNLYRRCASFTGNMVARHMMDEVFDIADGTWRGIGRIKDSALVLKDKYQHLDAVRQFGIEAKESLNSVNCICSEILLGLRLPEECRHYGTVCTPEHPYGPCMVSTEGACAAYYRYGRRIGNG